MTRTRWMDSLLLAGTEVPEALRGPAYVADLKAGPVTAAGRGALPLVTDDGGRAAAGFRGDTGDCVTRAVAIVTGRPYREVYDELNAFCRQHEHLRGHRPSAARTGIEKRTTRAYLAGLGLAWTPVMGIGTGCRVHLTPGELPDGRLIVSVTKHITAVIDGTVHDTYDPCRDGTRCVYGYWRAP